MFNQLQQILQSKKGKDVQVERVFIELASTCFFKCKTCKFWENKPYSKSETVSMSEYTSLIKDLKNICTNETEIQLTGGEPLLNKNLPQIVKLISKSGFKSSIVSNGWLLNKKLVEKLIDSNLTHISFSLDGEKNVHDFIRGKKGSYEKIMSGASMIKKISKQKGKHVNISATVTISGLNINNIVPLVKYILRNRNFDDIWMQSVSPPLSDWRIDISGKMNLNGERVAWFNHPEYKSLWPSDKANVKKVYSTLIKMKSKNKNISTPLENLRSQIQYFLSDDIHFNQVDCSYYKYLFIKINGDVVQCIPGNRKIGNIKDNSLNKIWNSNVRIKEKDFIKKCNINCHSVRNCQNNEVGTET